MFRMTKKGFTLVELMIVLAVIAIIAAFAIPNLMKSRMSANETSAIGTLRTFLSSQATYMNRNNVYGSMTDLHNEGLIDNSLAIGKKSGYFFGELDAESDFAYTIGAMPIDDGKSGEKEYCITQQGTIFEANFDSSAKTLTAAGGDIDWSNVAFTIPAEFVNNPEDVPATWTPIN